MRCHLIHDRFPKSSPPLPRLTVSNRNTPRAKSLIGVPSSSSSSSPPSPNENEDLAARSSKLAFTRVKPYICTMSLTLDDCWNQIQLNLSDLTRRAYGTSYVETLRVQVHANCRLRRIYFSDPLYSEEELPPEFKLYLPVQKA
ncbi:hypothetical protein QQ045_031409 [Rhodiola kirilowii]